MYDPKNKRLKLYQIMLKRGLANDEKEALSLIIDKRVYTDNKLLVKPGEVLKFDINITVKPKKKEYVSRAAVKLLHGLEFFKISPKGKVAIDVGCAVGGFSQVLLNYDVKKLYAVDVGYGEFDWSLRQDPRVILLERTNARYLNKSLVSDVIDLIVCDVSFISLKKALPSTLSLARKDANLVALIKPQFEVAKEDVGEKGIVMDSYLHKEVIEDIRLWLKSLGWNPIGVTKSPINGTKGNVEFLIGAVNG